MNWRIKRLHDRRAALVKQSEAILEKAAKEDDRELSAEESAAIESNRSELEKLAASIKREEDLQAFAASGQVVAVDGPLQTAGPLAGSVRPAFAEDPRCGFKSPREFLMAVLQNSDGPSTAARDERLRFLAAAGSDEQGGYADPYGGFLVPTGFAPDFLQLQPEDDPISSRVTNIPMTSPRVEIPARVDKDHTTSVSGGLIVTRRSETQSQNASRMQMEKVVMAAYSLFGLAYATEEILTDSPISFVKILEAGFRDQFTYRLTDERLNGTGVGEFEGIMNSPAMIQVAKDTNQAAATVSSTNVINMRSQCWHYDRAIWLANHDCLPQLIQLAILSASGFPISIYHPALTEDRPDMLLGRPIVYTEYCQSCGTAGDLVLANWAEYLEGTYEQMQSAASIHVRFVNHERTFKFWLRNAGKGWWRSPLTPKNSTKKLSPFVTLATRS
jgi:HK97 family phage major capsid protein